MRQNELNPPTATPDDAPRNAPSHAPSLSAQAMGKNTAAYLDGLNEKQLAAVQTLDGPLLLLAGAGTGKTKALTTRIAHLITTGRARPNQILAVTFTNKAAREMKNGLGNLLGGAVEGMPWMGTFHSISTRILRFHPELVGLQPNFTILDKDDQLRLMKQILRAENIDDTKKPERILAVLIDQWKNRALLPDNLPPNEAKKFDGKGKKLYALYQERLRTLNAADFGDLILHGVEILKKHPDILHKYQGWFHYILVDEYQDTNIAQYMWLRLLAQSHSNICCVGDDDQSIYGWRGAEVGNILRFEKDFKGAKIIRLEQNYRSTPHILAAASAVIAGNKTRLGKTLWTQRSEGEKLRLIHLPDSQAEARWVGEQIEDFQAGRGGRERASLEDMAILVRASSQMNAFENRFFELGLPYRVIGGPRFYERLEIRDAIAYFRLVVSPQDGLAFERILNTPKRGLGAVTLQKINQSARQHNVSVLAGAKILLEENGLPKKTSAALGVVIANFDRWSALMKDGMNHVELAQIILDESDYTTFWKNDKSAEAEGRLENLKELIKNLNEFENFGGFLEHVSLVMDNNAETSEEKVSIMTLHASKGLEFPIVFLPGWEDGLFPSARSMDEDGVKGVEEERRLAYVGITRAEELCLISFVSNRLMYNKWQACTPSRFIDELPPENVELLETFGYYGNRVNGGMTPRNGHTATDANSYTAPPPTRGERGRIIEATASVIFQIGDRILHPALGKGTVIGVESEKVSLVFDSGKTAKVMASYLDPA